MTKILCLTVAASGVLVPGAARAQDATPEPTCARAAEAPHPTARITAEEACATIRILAHDSLGGRRAGSENEARAASYLATRFQAIGLAPASENFLQAFSFPAALLVDPHALARDASSSDENTLSSANVVGIVHGTDASLSEQAVLVGAHYDHLGMGGRGSLDPDVHAVHNGADDNASGVAGLLEIAEAIAADPPRRTVVFVAFGAEELGIIGSTYYVNHPLWPIEHTVAMVNFDMIGRLREALTVYGTGTSADWPALLDALEQADNPPVTRVPDGFGPSDHAAFYGARIPVLAFFTGAHEAYHRPSDDVEQIDGEGLVRVATLAEATVRAIGDRDAAIEYAEAPRTERRAARFSVGLGIMPDYAYADDGVMVTSVRPGGPAEAAGMMGGDILVELDGRPVEDVYGYTEVLSGLEAGVEVAVVFVRGDETLSGVVTPAAR